MSAFALTKSKSNVLVSMKIAINLVRVQAPVLRTSIRSSTCMPFQSLFNGVPAAVAGRCGVCDPNATDVTVTDSGAGPRADVRTQREPLAPTN